MRRHKSGFTVIELLVGVCILAFVITMGANIFKASFSRWEVNEGVRMVTAAMSRARYNAIKMNRPVKFFIEENRIYLREKVSGRWKTFMSFDVDDNVTLSINSSPVFSPTGFASPLCSIYVENKRFRYKITLSMAGRIKTTRLKPQSGSKS